MSRRRRSAPFAPLLAAAALASISLGCSSPAVTRERYVSASAERARISALIQGRFGARGAEAVAIARCESSLDPAARNGAHYGLFQISDVHLDTLVRPRGWAMMDLLRPEPNIEVAWALFVRAEQSWRPWACAAALQPAPPTTTTSAAPNRAA
ncbi:MAG: transglycosylase SLT domain-containing protein [Acidimicrobiales bacterium]